MRRILRDCFFLLGLGLTPCLAVEGFGYDDLVHLIDSRKLDSIEAVLANLPPDLLSNYTLAYRSRSLQDAEPEYPRAILFGRDARLIITFNGRPGQRNYDELEVLDFDDVEKRFEMRAVKFGAQVEFSAANPEVCLNCHGLSPRPIWGTYDYEDKKADHWPGFYGSTHDTPKSNAEELAAFERFRANAGDHPRYRHLKRDDTVSPWFPYGAGPHQHYLRPNNRLGNLLARLNAQRVARQVTEGAFFDRFRHLALAWLVECPGTRSEDFTHRIRTLFESAFPRAGHVGLYQDLAAVASENRLAFMFEKLLTGLETYTWNMSLTTTPRGRRFFTGILSVDQLVAGALMPRIVAADDWLRQYYRPWSNRQVYDTFQAGYYDHNVAPGGVGAVYDTLGSYFDAQRMAGACDVLMERAQAERRRVPSRDRQ